jgi:hypothetical protein
VQPFLRAQSLDGRPGQEVGVGPLKTAECTHAHGVEAPQSLNGLRRLSTKALPRRHQRTEDMVKKCKEAPLCLGVVKQTHRAQARHQHEPFVVEQVNEWPLRRAQAVMDLYCKPEESAKPTGVRP